MDHDAVAEPRHNVITAAGGLVRAAARGLLRVALPPLCPSCRGPLADAGGLCARCWSQLAFITRPYCERLGTPLAHDAGPGILSGEAVANPPAYGRARAAVQYDDVAASLVHALKYGDRLDLAPMLARWMAVAGRDIVADADAIVPVPLHWRRLWMRRFNQSAALGAAIGREAGRPFVFDALRRVKPTPQQVGLSRDARAANVQGAFRLDAAAQARLRGRRVVLVDDVLTSGATVEACARALMRGGVAAVGVLVFARVVKAGSIPI
ncbi:MAG: ComF family protein [Rhizobiales bacterium]|nr:ComF family protein [Hyphomicrobiales bacterium]